MFEGKNDNEVRLWLGEAGSGKTYFIKKQITDIIVNSEDSIVIFSSDENANEYVPVINNKSSDGVTVEISVENVEKQTVDIPHGFRTVLFKVSFPTGNRKFSDEAYNLCLKAIDLIIQENHLSGKRTRLIIDGIRCLSCYADENRKLLCEIIRKSENLSCSVDLSATEITEMYMYEEMNNVLHNYIDRFTIIRLFCKDKELIEKITGVTPENYSEIEMKRKKFYYGRACSHYAIIQTRRDKDKKFLVFGKAGEGKAFYVDITNTEGKGEDENADF